MVKTQLKKNKNTQHDYFRVANMGNTHIRMGKRRDLNFEIKEDLL